MVKPGPIDPDTYVKVNAVITSARVRGLSLIEELNRIGLLLTPAQDKRIRLEAMSFIADQMSNWSPVEFLRRKHRNLNVTTQQDLYNCIYEWIVDHITHVREKT